MRWRGWRQRPSVECLATARVPVLCELSVAGHFKSGVPDTWPIVCNPGNWCRHPAHCQGETLAVCEALQMCNGISRGHRTTVRTRHLMFEHFVHHMVFEDRIKHPMEGAPIAVQEHGCSHCQECVRERPRSIVGREREPKHLRLGRCTAGDLRKVGDGRFQLLRGVQDVLVNAHLAADVRVRHVIAARVHPLQQSVRIREHRLAAWAVLASQALRQPLVRHGRRWDARPLQRIVRFACSAASERGDGEGLRGLLRLNVLLGEARRMHGEPGSLDDRRSKHRLHQPTAECCQPRVRRGVRLAVGCVGESLDEQHRIAERVLQQLCLHCG
mmetsp:Transcript_10425/g.36587  ORF Transcript_10425/g.36587 Transcript_10425/m.36587 type:complete len:328 (-) Transcript_10425:4242-5225(-)